uniref:Reverse transcriptase domain-containing protein n=1 Tax=Seriola dumerili TaxID=41447 RepID=A0A3B4T3X5_SERDU
TAVIKPLLKKKNLDPNVIANYQPISNLPFLSKILEKTVYIQLKKYLTSNSLLDIYQSGFRPHHSTETALIKVINDLHINTDSKKISILVLLDLSAAFDTVDHKILLERLEKWVGLSGPVLKWFNSYLHDRKSYVSISDFSSNKKDVTCGVPQGSILGPLLFNLYMLPLSHIITNHNVNYHNYADDSQLYISLYHDDLSPIQSLTQCISDINKWMTENFLQLNKDKTEILIFGAQTQRLRVAEHLKSLSLESKTVAKNLGIIMDSNLNFRSHINHITKSSFYHLKNISKLRSFLSKPDSEKLIHAFITSRLDYCNGLFT